MTAHLVWQGMKCGKARVACAICGIAAAVFAFVFTATLAATNSAQAPLLAARAAAPWAAWRRVEAPRKAAEALSASDAKFETIALTLDLRPGGRVMQGPPMRVMLAAAPGECPYEALTLVEGRWPDSDAAGCEVVCLKRALSRFGAPPPPLGENVKFVGRRGTMTARIVGYLDSPSSPMMRLPRGFPDVFANAAAIAALAAEERALLELWRTTPAAAPDSAILTPSSPSVAAAFTGDEQRRMDYARPLMFIAAILSALSLLVNSLLLGVEANKPTLARLRLAGLERPGLVKFTLLEAIFCALPGWALGVAASLIGVVVFVALSPGSFPAGAVFSASPVLGTLAALVPLVAAAGLFALAPLLKVRPLDALRAPKRNSRRGMTITFALGFAAFVAVEVWGASLMRAFVPSQEWPDAIVSLLPGGVSAFEIEKLRDIEGVKRISELLPLQVPLSGAEESPSRPSREAAHPARARQAPDNVLFLGSSWLPDFVFAEGTREEALAALDSGGVVISSTISRAKNLHKGDKLLGLDIAAVVDVNWHMVTSRGLVRGLNGAPPMTLGPVFATFDTVEGLDRRPAPFVKMTHLWVEYESDFLARHGVFAAGRRIESEIARRLGYPGEATIRLHARDEIADGTLAHGSNVIGAAARVPLVFLFVLAIGFVAMIVAEADGRRRSLAILRAVGATRLELAATLGASALKTAIAGILIALPIGAAAGYAATFKTAAIWPGLARHFAFPVAIIAEGALFAILFALVFAIPVAVRCTRPAR